MQRDEVQYNITSIFKVAQIGDSFVSSHIRKHAKPLIYKRLRRLSIQLIG